MAFETNIVTPSVTGPDEIWFDPRASRDNPTWIKGPQEGTDNPQEIKLKLDQSLAVPPNDQDYLADGTLWRTNDSIELYRSKDLNEASKLDFCENQARISNLDLALGLTLYAKGLATGFVDLKLTLDLLETATRKKTYFKDGTTRTLINVNNDDAGAKKTLQLLPAEVVSPVIQLGSPNTQVTASGKPVALNFKVSSNVGMSTYDGTGQVTINPTNAKVKFYKDAKCDPGDEVNLSGGHTISNSDLKSGALTLYARSTSDTATGQVVVQLALANNKEPLKVATASPAQTTLTLLPTSKVTPTITTTIDPSHDSTVWYPTLAEGAVPYVTFGVTESNDTIPFKGEGLLTRGNDNIALFYDKKLTKPLAFVENTAALATTAICGKIPFYIKAAKSGNTSLKFELVNDCQPAIQIQEPVETSVKSEQITEVVPNVNWQSGEIRILPESQAGQGTPVRVFITQKTDGGGDFTGTAVLTRSDKLLGVYKSDKKSLFSSNSLTVTLPNDTIKNTSNEYTVQWLGLTPPEDTVSLTLTPAQSSDPYIVTDPSTQLAAVHEVGEPPLVVEKINTVTPVIETDYDLVLQAKGFEDGDPKNATSPTLAHFYCTQSDELIGYEGDGTLARDAANIRIFRDRDLKDELPFVGNKATIPNADLLRKGMTYYIQGVSDGKCTLTLSLAKPPIDLGVRPNFTVADPAVKELAVIALTLEVLRDQAKPNNAIDVGPMSNHAKWQTGRFMPLQNAEKQFGMVPIVVRKVATDTWPSGAAHHVVTLTISDDKVELFDLSKNKKALPLVLKKSEAGNDHQYLLQSTGDQPSTQARDIHISLGLDRTDKDDAEFADAPDSIKPARNGDWTDATIVKISSVTPDIDDWRQYTNQPINYYQSSNYNQNAVKKGQHALVTATTEPAIKGIGIDFMLWADPDNEKDVPASTKSMPLKDHQPTVTGTFGTASTRLKIGRFGGQKFTAVAYLAEDAVAGVNMAANATTAPDSYKSKPLTAWRKIDYKVVSMKRHDVPDYDGNYSDLFNSNALNATFAARFLELDLNGGGSVVANTPALYTSTAGRTPLYTDWLNDRLQDGTLGPLADRTFNLAFVESIAKGTSQSTTWYSNLTVIGKKFSVNLGRQQFDTSATARYMVPGSARLAKYTLGFIRSWQETIPDNNVKLLDNGNATYTLEIDLTGVNTHNTAYKDLWIQIKLINCKTICGLSLGGYPIVMSGDRYAEQIGNRAQDEVYATTAHEVGHFLGLAPKTLPGQTATNNKVWYYGRNGRTRYFNRNSSGAATTETSINSQIGTGPHCMTGFSSFSDLRQNLGNRSKVKCLMYHATVNPPITDVCETCLKSVSGREYALANTSDADTY